MNRPLGVTIIAIIDMLFGLVGICVGITAATSALLVAMSKAVGTNILAGSFIVLAAAAVSIFIVLFNGIQFYVGIGLFLTQKWAYTWARILAVIGIVAGVVQIVVSLLGGNMDLTFSIGTGLNAIIIQAIILVYLSRKDMREVFTN